MKLTYSLFFALFIHSLGTAQVPVYTCGNSDLVEPLTTKRLEANQAAAVLPRNNVVYVPLKLHLVAKTDGTGRLSDKEAFRSLCLLNNDFIGANIQFYLKDGTFNYVNNTTIYNNPTLPASIFLLQNERDARAINVIVSEVARPADDGDNSIIAGFYSPGNDWVVMRKDAMNKWAFPHELGHYFSLMHTHLGWDSEPYNPAIHGIPAPAVSPDGLPTEKVDRSNCETAGDRICDTPADYNGITTFSCTYEGGALDPDSVLIDPDEHNYMSYFSFCDRGEYSFSGEQISIIQKDLASASRTKLSPGSTPAFAELSTEGGSLIQPINNSSVPLSEPVRLEWEAVEGAEYYTVEVDRIPTYVLNPITVTVSEPFVEIDPDLLRTNTNYYWRITPYNRYFFCESASPSGSFKTLNSTSSRTLEMLTDFRVFPAPITAQQPITVQIQSIERFKGVLYLTDLQGRRIGETKVREFYPGDNEETFSLNNLVSGLYLMVLETPQGRTFAKVPVVD
jgi:hypothetical protein